VHRKSYSFGCVTNVDQETETIDPVCHYGKSNLKEVLRVG